MAVDGIHKERTKDRKSGPFAWWKTLPNFMVALAALLGALAAAGIIFPPPAQQPTPVVTPTPVDGGSPAVSSAPHLMVKVTDPIDKSQVVEIQEVRGTSAEVPQGDAVWVVLYPPDANRFYPQHAAAVVDGNGNWTSKTYFGVHDDAGKQYDIQAILADEAAQQVFTAYNDDANQHDQWPGLVDLPTGAKIYDTITVVRK